MNGRHKEFIKLNFGHFSVVSFSLLGNGLKWVHIPVKDEKPPDVEQAKEFVELINTAKMNNEV